MRVAQYVYFGIRSDTVPADAISEALQLTPDDVMVRAAREPERVSPRQHGWYVRCDTPGLCVDDQLAVVIQRIKPALPALDRLLEQHADLSTVVTAVRKFGEG